MKKADKREVILAFGEDINDTRALRELVVALQPDLPKTQVVPKPIILRRPVELKKIAKRRSEIVNLVAAARVKANVVAVVIHHDLDDFEPRETVTDISPHEAELEKDYSEFKANGVSLIVALPAWEMEAWWLMWPRQVAKHRTGWQRLKDRNHERVDLIKDAKEVLRRETRPQKPARTPEYTESDAPSIARYIREDGVIREPRGKSVAFQIFSERIDKLSGKLKRQGHSKA